MGNWQIAPGSFAVSSKPGSHGVRIAHDATIRSQLTNDHAVSGRAGQKNPHRGRARFEAKIDSRANTYWRR